MNLVDEMLAGNRLALSRLITKVENRDPELPSFLKKIFPKTGKAQIWGLTGPPGSGKSTLLDRITLLLRKKGLQVAVAAVDPTSPFTGGALLGDRIRMQQHATDEGVFVRSLGTRGKHGGLSHAAKEVVWVLDAAGFDVVLVETAGVGQTELDILRLAQTVMVTLVPESGDSIQVMKAGLMEIADVFIVNKSDRPAADKIVRELLQMVQMSETQEGGWKIPVHKTEAIRGEGLEAVVEAVQAHQEYLTQSGKRGAQFEEFIRAELGDILTERVCENLDKYLETEKGRSVLREIASRKNDPYQVCEQILREGNLLE